VSRQISSAAEIDTWLRDGGLVVTASERAARSLTLAFHRARRAGGLSAWPAPNIQDWQTFVRSAWNERSFDGRFVLNALQEQSLWAGIAAAGGQTAALLEGPRHRLAALAMDAHSLLCAYSPKLLKQSARSGWDSDAAAFSAWLTVFEDACRSGNMVSAARLPLELINVLEAETAARPPLLLAGFDRILHTQRKLFDVWGSRREAPIGEPAPEIQFHSTGDPATELAACADWCMRHLTVNANARLLVVTQDASQRRGEIEREFLRSVPIELSRPSAANLFEFSLGVPLNQVALARSAGLVLRWLAGSIEEHELDWLFSTGHTAADADESRALTALMRALRRRGLQRTRWTLAEFLRQTPYGQLPDGWVARMKQAQRSLDDFSRSPQSPLAWAELVPKLLERAGWPGGRPLVSAEFQAHRRWQQTVDLSAGLGFEGRRMNWREYLAALDRTVSETLYAPESQDAPILIAGPAESAGLFADAIWFLGASEDAWPASGSTHPLLPLAVQREARMPHASAQVDWDVAAALTRRLLASAPEIHFSYARQTDGVDARPSRLVTQLAGAAQPLASEFFAQPVSDPLAVPFFDASRVPFPAGTALGGSSILTAQSQCGFKAFATARLGAQDWEPAEAGLTASERGLLLHEVLHSIWAGLPDGIRTHHELVALIESNDLASFVERHVVRAQQKKMPARAGEQMPQQYLDLERERLRELVTEWLQYESARVPFTVVETELDTNISIDGLALDLRLDRVDRLNDETLLVVDYKTGDVSPRAWDLPRPNDIQLPLYAGFAIAPDAGAVGGLVFAKIRAGDRKEFAGRVTNACSTLKSDLHRSSGLVRNPLAREDLARWRRYIEQMARNFLSGRADVDPREYPETCERCGLQAICRIQENQPLSDADEGDTGEEAVDG
jgi:probable DNA repair protein